MSVGLEFQQARRPGGRSVSMIAFMLAGLASAAVDFDEDLDAGVRRRLAAGDQALADLLERLLRIGTPPGRPFGRTFTPFAADVPTGRRTLTVLDVLLDDGRPATGTRRSGPQPQISDAGVGGKLLTACRC